MPNTVLTNQQAKTLFNFQGPSGVGPGIAGAVKFTPETLPNGSGQQSDVLDLGPSPRASLFEWRARATVGAPAGLGGTVQIFLSTSDDASLFDANLPSGNQGALSLDKRRNLQYVGGLSVDVSEVSGVPCISSGMVNIYSRYAAVVWFNMTGVSLSSTQGDHLMQLAPSPEQIENS